VLQGRVQRLALVSLTNLWRFDATTNDYGSDWKDLAFDEASWRGPSNALFFTLNGPLAGPKKTQVPLSFNGARIHSYYYRTHFAFPETPSSGVTLVASNLVDDGAVFYLNGLEVGRLRMPDGPITRATFALPGGYATNLDVLNLSAGSLVQGDNLLAVEVHFDSETSSATAFGMSLEAVAVNHLPVPASPVLERYASGGLKVRALLLLGTDPDGDALVLSAVDPTSAQGGSVRTDEGWVIYTPPPGVTNQDSFGYTVGDGRGGFSAGTATVVVAHSAGPSVNLTWADLTNGQVRVSGSGIPHRPYVIEFTESLSPPLWQLLGTVETDAFGVLEYVDQPPAGAPARFYRTVSP